MEHCVVLGLHSFSKLFLSLFNTCLTGGASAYGSLLELTILGFKDPVHHRALFTVEVGARFTVVSNVLKRKLGPIAILARALESHQSFVNQLSSVFGGSQFQGSVTSGVLDSNVATLGQEALEHFQTLLVRGSLMNGRVAVHIDFKR